MSKIGSKSMSKIWRALGVINKQGLPSLVSKIVVLNVSSAGKRSHLLRSVLLFSKLNKLFFGYFDPEKIFLDNENK